jgi:fumarate reductase iron-sulfur subunit
VRDLVVELEGFLEKLKSVKPYILRAKERALEEGTHRQSPAQLEEFKQFSYCINCMLCYSACPVVANEPEFIGPAAIALGHRYNMDSRDEGQHERNEIFRGEGTVFSCSYANECSEVCPKHVDPAAAINQAKFNAVIDWLTGFVTSPRGGK